MQTTIRCSHPKCEADITERAKYYDKQADGRYSKVYCEECMERINKSYKD